MDRRETAALLALMAARDGRQVGAVEVEAWHEDIGRWDLATAREAVHRHYTRSRDFMRPYDLIRAIREIRGERLDAYGEIVPPSELADAPQAEIAWRRSRREAIAAGLVPPASDPPALLPGSQHPEIASRIREIADSKRVPDRDGEPEQAARETPAPTVDEASTAAMEAERRRQLDALEAMKAAPDATGAEVTTS